MAKKEETLCYGSVELTLTKDKIRLKFSNFKLDDPIIVLEKTFHKLLQAFEDISPLAIEKASAENIEGEVFFEKVLDTYNIYHQICLEGTIYRGKPYIFLKRRYKKEDKWLPAKGCIGLNWAEDFFRISSLLENNGIKINKN